MSRGYTYEEVVRIFDKNGCKLISKEYKNNRTKLDYICECGKENKIALTHFMRGNRCRSCSFIKTASKKRHVYIVLKAEYEAKGCKLISTEYINNKQALTYICHCGNTTEASYLSFKKSDKCNKCSGNENLSYEDVKAFFEKSNCVLLSEKYLNSKTKMRYICSCGNEHHTTFDNFRTSKRCYECRNKAIGEKKKGVLSNWYNPNLTGEERIKNRYDENYRVWRKSVFERDDYTCKCCSVKGGILNAYHLDGFHWNVERRYDLTNGITLCNECHRDFHNKYGNKNNTELQFIEYLNNKPLEKLS